MQQSPNSYSWQQQKPFAQYGPPQPLGGQQQQHQQMVPQQQQQQLPSQTPQQSQQFSQNLMNNNNNGGPQSSLSTAQSQQQMQMTMPNMQNLGQSSYPPSNIQSLSSQVDSNILSNENNLPSPAPAAQFNQNQMPPQSSPLRHLPMVSEPSMNMQYYANVAPVPVQQVQFVPCMCPVSVSVTTTPEVVANKRADEVSQELREIRPSEPVAQQVVEEQI